MANSYKSSHDASYDVIVIGSGVNGLGSAALLAAKGKRVLVLEANEKCGGAVRTEEVTLPGFKHDLFATNLSLFAGGPIMAALKDDLMRHGLEFVPSAQPFCSVFPDGKSLGIRMDREANIASLKKIAPNDVEAWQNLTALLGKFAPHLFPLLGAELPSWKAARSLYKTWRAIGTDGLFQLIRLLLQSSRAFTDEYFVHPETKALAATWGMHLDYSPDISGGALFSFLESIGGQEFGMVIGKGGAATIINALAAVIKEKGGEIRTSSRVTSIETTNDKVVGVKVGQEFIAAHKVIANVNPALIPALLGSHERNNEKVNEVTKFRPGLGTMMIHCAMSELPSWKAEEARGFNYVHIAPYVDDMAMAYTQAAAGKLPTTPTLVVGQPTLTDPSRAPEGKHVLWIQVRVLPLDITGDASNEISGTSWDEIGERYADRVMSIIESYAPGTKEKILARKVLTPKDLERYNANLIKGDSLGGSHHPAQFFFLRPTPSWSRHRTPIRGLFICGSGTWPGGGVGGGSGAMVADAVLKG
ncbi:MAG: phytoene desaturase family protein [Candidatus Nanopelagicaceae bacterium]